MNTIRFAPVAATAAVLLLAPAPAQQQPTGYDENLARYQECIKRLPFQYHTEGREKLAGTRCMDALEILVADYSKPPAYPEHARYTLAALFGRHFQDASYLDTFRGLRKAHDKTGDAWLWVNTLTIEATHGDAEQVVAVAQTDRDMVRRATALLALGEARHKAVSRAIAAACVDFPRKEADRNVLVGAMSGAILANRDRVNDTEFRTALQAYIGLLADDVKLTHTVKIQIARHLQWVLNGPALFIDPESWLELLQRGEVKQPRATSTSARPRFFGVETEGERFCYVVDMSDSMCKEITPNMRPAGPITGPRKRPKGVLPDENDLPWHLIKTRFDLAREQLKISLQRLSKDKYFSIVWFGDESGTLDSCRGMMKATPGNVRAVIAELDSIQLGKPDATRSPDGVLRGKTNMHSGLRRAFGLWDRGYVETDAYVHPATLTDGCDTIFLLSDGEPSWDDFHVTDKDYGEGKVIVDSEYGAAAPRTPQLVYWGPYHRIDWLVADVERMNAFRRVRIHCIGIGEANMQLLRRLAETSRGQVFEFGSR